MIHSVGTSIVNGIFPINSLTFRKLHFTYIIRHEFDKANEVLQDHMTEYKNLEIPEGFEIYS